MEGLVKITINDTNFTQESWKRIEAARTKCPKCQRCGEPVMPGTVCDCLTSFDSEKEKKIKQRAWDINRLGGVLAADRYTLASYDNERAKKAVSGYPGQNLYIWGRSGAGKTHLATALVRRFQQGRVIRAAALARQLAEKSPELVETIIKSTAAERFLVIDDLATDIRWGLGGILEVIAQRELDGMTGLIITSNLGLQELGEKMGDDRLSSRLAVMCKILELTGPDRRFLHAKERNAKG
jgi:DNA replication protein DnaC